MIFARKLSNVLLDPDWDEVKEHAAHSWKLSSITLLLTVILEICSLETVRNIWMKQKDGKSLYIKAVASNIVNHIFIGIPIYVIAAMAFCTKEQLSSIEQSIAVLYIWAIHSVLYYFLHRAFHEYPKLYWIHKFHHRFNTYICPVSANAVTLTEYTLAYVVPFTIALMAHGRIDTFSLNVATMIMSILNLIVHTPKIEEWSAKWVPNWLVSTNDHMEHHRKLTMKYASPTFNIDYFQRRADAYFGKKKE